MSPEPKQGEVDASTLVATVSVQLVPEDPDDAEDDEDDDDDVEAEQVETTVTYDVLVRGADTAAPYVTAWGPAGSGPSLADHENAAALDGSVDEAPTGPLAPTDGGGEEPAARVEGED